MGKGLSSLQERILLLAWQRGGAALTDDLLGLLWGPENGTQPFSRCAVGQKRYVQRHVALSRSISRLKIRGLVRVFKDVDGGTGTAIILTALGREWGEWLESSVKQSGQAGISP